MHFAIAALSFLLAADAPVADKPPAPHPRDVAQFDADANYDAGANYIADAAYDADANYEAEANFDATANFDPMANFDADAGFVRAYRVGRVTLDESAGTVLGGVGGWFDSLPERTTDADDPLGRATAAAIDELRERHASLTLAVARGEAGDDLGALQAKRRATRHATLAHRAVTLARTLAKRSGAAGVPELDDTTRRLDLARRLVDGA